VTAVPDGLPEPARSLLTAVESEIDAILANSENVEKIPLAKGERRSAADGGGEYLFSCPNWKPEFHSDQLLIRLTSSRDRWQPAEAAQMSDGKVLVRTPADLGAKPGSADLCQDETSPLKALADRIRWSAAPTGSVDLTTSGWLLGMGDPPLGRHPRPQDLVSGYRGLRLNERQRLAVERALANGITFVWGPPGTGKTDVVSLITEGCHRQGERVLFLSPTNVAVDQALERVCERLENEEGFDLGLVQRAGVIQVATLRERYGSRIDVDMITGRLSTELLRRSQDLTQQRDTALEGVRLHERVAQAHQVLVDTRQALNEADSHAGRWDAEARNCRRELDDVRQQIARIGDPTGLRAKRKAAQLDQFHGRAMRLEHTIQHAVAQRDQALATSHRHKAETERAAQALSAAHSKVSGLPAHAVLIKRVEEVDGELQRVNDELGKVADSVRARCRVMGTTIAKALRTRSIMDDVDTVIIDEAGMVDLPSAWCAAGLAKKRVVVAGDFRQLPAVTHGSDNKEAGDDAKRHSALWMDRDAFHAAGLIGPDGRAKDDPRMVRLDTQYRMRPGICAVVNEVAYPDSPLRTGRDDSSRLPSSPLLDRDVVLVDTTERRVPLMGNGRHLTNQVHEAVIHELVRGLQFDSVLPSRNASSPDVLPSERMAVIAPYRNQVKSLQGSLEYRFGEEYVGLADTVHRFQGSQRPLVILDTVAGAGRTVGRLVEGTGLASQTTRLLNVALSRAQDHLIVVADVGFLRQNLRPDSETLRMLEVLERTARRIPIDDLAPIRSAADLAGLSTEELNRPAFFPADEVYRAVEWDIDQAVKSIDVFCPFLDPGPVQRWLDRLHRRVGAGVKVTVFTRAHKAGEKGARLAEHLRRAGCEVVGRERMHEKVLIIDDTVLWHGSLNLLATSAPTDLMMRLTDPAACTRVRRIVDRARSDRRGFTPPPTAPPPPKAPASGVPDRVDAIPETGQVVGDRLYLNVPYKEKDEAKRLVKAEWHKAVKKWWVPADTPRDDVARWL
jgi:hypothetical protein